jgi:hypothetical protein
MAGSLEEMFAKKLNNPNDIMGQQYQYLRDMNRIPTMELGLGMDIGHEGSFDGITNRIKVNPFATNPERTLVHELQHAVTNRLGAHRNIINRDTFQPTLEEERFADAVSKLHDVPTKIPMEGLDRYRSSAHERQSYGVANSRYPGKDVYEGTPHLDATMATEQAILLDLANRALKSNRAPAQAAPKVDPIDSAINAGSEKLVQLKDWAMKYLKK